MSQEKAYLRPLDPESLFRTCDSAAFPFETTDQVEPLDQVVGQDRAVAAVRFAIGMRHRGYNLFVLGAEGTGKYSLARRFLEAHAAEQPVPDDWCYVNNFAEPHRPRALRLPPGQGRVLRQEMDDLIRDLRETIPAAFESDEYRDRRNVILEQLRDMNDSALGELQKEAAKHDIALIRTPVGLALAPVHDGEVLKPEDFNKLPEEDRRARAKAMEGMQAQLEQVLGQLPKWEKDHREKLRELDREVISFAVDHQIDELKARWEAHPTVIEYLVAVRDDVIESADDFRPKEGGGQAMAMLAGQMAAQGAPSFRRYQVNVVIDHSDDLGQPGEDSQAGGAPVVYEDHPTQPNLVGRIEYLSQFGAMFTDLTLIKGGALHRANGGYLILDARRVLMQPFCWEALMRMLRAGCIRIESARDALGLAGMSTLEPEPIPMDVKVVLLGEPQIYYLLGKYDPDFRELFKVAADFDSRMDRDDASALEYARLIATLARQEGLKPLDRTGVARVVEHGARLADDSEKLTTHMATIVDIVREADYWAGEAGAGVTTGEHVQRAIDAKTYRSDRIREALQEQIIRGTIVVETEGAVVGQINGLAVLQLDHFAFGKPSRISCRVRIGRGEVVDIEREVALSGPLHSKGVLILSSFLSSRFAGDAPLSLSASLVFEQSYGGVDGDSASSTELYALLSALAEIPIKQSLAVTGSVDQNGRVQAIGGVNEKIEGFFDVCAARGLTGEQGVMIPATNVKHLMLRGDVVAAVRAGKFRIHAVETIDQGIEILTGVPAGAADDAGEYPIGTVNRAVAKRLESFTRKAIALARARERERRGGRGGGGSEGEA